MLFCSHNSYHGRSFQAEFIVPIEYPSMILINISMGNDVLPILHQADTWPSIDYHRWGFRVEFIVSLFLGGSNIRQ